MSTLHLWYLGDLLCFLIVTLHIILMLCADKKIQDVSAIVANSPGQHRLVSIKDRTLRSRERIMHTRVGKGTGCTKQPYLNAASVPTEALGKFTRTPRMRQLARRHKAGRAPASTAIKSSRSSVRIITVQAELHQNSQQVRIAAHNSASRCVVAAAVFLAVS